MPDLTVPEIIIYSTDAEVPAALSHIGFFRSGKSFLPLRINGSSPDEVQTVGTKWWEDEKARQAKIKGGPKKPPAEPAEQPKPIAASVADPFEDLL